MAIITDQPANAADIKSATRMRFEVVVVDKSQEVDTTSGVYSVNFPFTGLGNYNLVRTQARIPFNGSPGVTGPTTIQVRNLTKYPNNDALSTAISIASGAMLGTPGTINTTYDDASTDDEIKIYVVTQSTTKPKGLIVMLEYELP